MDLADEAAGVLDGDGASVRYFAAAVIVWAWTVVLAVRMRSWNSR